MPVKLCRKNSSNGTRTHFSALSNEYIIKLYSTTCVTRYQVDTLWIYGKFHAFQRALNDDSRAFDVKEKKRTYLIYFRNTSSSRSRKSPESTDISHKTFHIFQSSCVVMMGAVEGVRKKFDG